MQDRWDVYDNKPRYFHGFVDSQTLSKDAIFLRFDVTDNIELDAADNESWRRVVYINGTLYTRNGFEYEKYQILAERIETECAKAGIIFNFLGDSYDASQDSESSISYINFEAEQRLTMN